MLSDLVAIIKKLLDCDDLLDTNTVSELMKQNKYTWGLMLEKKPNEVFLCEIVISEIYYGLQLLGDTKKRVLLQQEFEPIAELLQALVWDRETSQKFAEIKADLTNRGLIIPDLDIAIAAHAKRYNCILVTDNISDFQRISGLTIENWLR